jgi:hypothetical protein
MATRPASMSTNETMIVVCIDTHIPLPAITWAMPCGSFGVPGWRRLPTSPSSAPTMAEPPPARDSDRMTVAGPAIPAAFLLALELVPCPGGRAPLLVRRSPAGHQAVP